MAKNNIPPELQQLLAESVNRTKYQNPLFQATSKLAYSMLPTYARDGEMGPMGPAAPIQPYGETDGGGGVSDIAKMLGAGLGGAALNSLGGGNALKAIVNALKKLFGGRRPTSPGNDANLWPEMGPQSPVDPNWFPGATWPAPPQPSPSVTTDEWPGAWPEPGPGSNGFPVDPSMFPNPSWPAPPSWPEPPPGGSAPVDPRWFNP